MFTGDAVAPLLVLLPVPGPGPSRLLTLLLAPPGPGMSALRALPARRSASSSHANSTVSDVCVTCSSLPSVRRSYFPPLRRLLLLPPLLQQPNRQPLAINKHKEGKKKEGVVGVTSVAADGRTDARTEGRTEGAPTYKLPSVKPEPDVRLRRAVPSLVITEQLFKTCILIAAELQPGEVSCCLSLLLHLSRPPLPKKTCERYCGGCVPTVLASCMSPA